MEFPSRWRFEHYAWFGLRGGFDASAGGRGSLCPEETKDLESLIYLGQVEMEKVPLAPDRTGAAA